MRVLVTGADGFVGTCLCAYLASQGDELIAFGGPHGSAAEQVDVRDAHAVAAMVEGAAADWIVHLAAWSSVGTSYHHPAECFAVTALGSVHLLDAVRKHAPKARVLLVSSGEIYGELGARARFTELDPPAPKSPYASAKVAAELMARQYRESFGLDVIIARPFNHVGPGQDERFVIPAMVRQLKEVRAGQASPRISVGNLDPVRDFSSVFDVVEAYRLLLEHGVSGETYNICSGRPSSIRDIVLQLAEAARVQVELVTDPSRVRPSDIAKLVGDPSKIRALGFAPTRSPLFGIF